VVRKEESEDVERRLSRGNKGSDNITAVLNFAENSEEGRKRKTTPNRDRPTEKLVQWRHQLPI